MVNKILMNPGTRFAMVFQMAVIALASFILLRVGFAIKSWSLIDHGAVQWLCIFGRGLMYDMAFIGYFYIPFVSVLLIFPNKWLGSAFSRIWGQIIGFLIVYGLFFSSVAEWIFWDEFGVRFNFISVDYLVYRREVTDNILQSYPVFRILFFLLLLAVPVCLLVRPFYVSAMDVREKFSRRLVIALSLLLIPAASFLFLDQSFRNFSTNNYENELASNGPYQLFAAFRNNTLDYRQFYKTGDEKQLSARLKQAVWDKSSRERHKGMFNIARHIESGAPPRKLNVILISIESLSAKFLTRFGEQKNITPFMDEWFRQGKLFTNFYATGTRTARGLEAITLSIPPTPGRSVVKRPDNSCMFTLGKVFRDQGYDTAFLYGGRGYFDNMNAFFSGNGYRIVDQTRLKGEEITFKNAWGVCDGDLYNRTISEADRSSASHTPFFFHVMTTSNHRPFTYPDGKIDLPPGDGRTGSGRDGAVKYTDYALGQFMAKARTRSWFDHTLFVVLADHCSSSAGRVGLPVKKYHIPLFIYAPGYIGVEEIGKLSSQIDVAPTILSLLHFSYDTFFFGQDILAPDFKERAFIANYQKLGLLTDKEFLFLSPGKEINRVDRSLKVPFLESVNSSYPLVDELMAYYQGADYILATRLNRWSENKKGVALSSVTTGTSRPERSDQGLGG